jgi:hypothetical protein
MTPKETFDWMRERWAEQIPEAYRWTDDHSGKNHITSAIVGPVGFFAQIIPDLAEAPKDRKPRKLRPSKATNASG